MLLLVLPPDVRAQSDHYWSETYGTEATLLGGVVIGGVEDMSATYYNPGAIGLIEKPAFILSAHLYEARKLVIEDALGAGHDLSTTDVNGLPGFVGGSLRFSWLGRSKLAYSILSRQKVDTRLTARRSDLIDFPNLPEENLVTGGGEAILENHVSDTWAGLTWARPLSSHLGIGISGYGAVRSARTRSEREIAGIETGGNLAVSSFSREASSSIGRLVFKGGMQYRTPKVGLGVTVTAPGLKVFGSGDAWLSRARTGFDVDGDGNPDTLLAQSNQEGLSADFKTPLSVGGGASFLVGRTNLYGSVEWFQSIDPYAVLDTAPVTANTGDVFPNSYDRAGDSIVNWGIGVRHTLPDSVSFYLSYTTDYSTAVRQETTDPGSQIWDLSHIAGGMAFQVKRVNLVLGLSYGSGSKEVTGLESFLGRDSNGGADDGDPGLKVTEKRFRALLGFSVQL